MLSTQLFLKDIENQLVIFLNKNFDFSKNIDAGVQEVFYLIAWKNLESRDQLYVHLQ